MAKIPLTHLIKDDPYLLGILDLRIISALLCLIAIRFEFTDRGMQAIPPGDRTHLLKTWTPGPSWQIWIARYLGDRGDEHWCRHFGMRVVSSPTNNIHSAECNTQITTMVMGKLCAHLFSSTIIDNWTGYNDAPLTKIWPASQYYVDTRDIPDLSDEEIVSLHEALPAAIKPAI